MLAEGNWKFDPRNRNGDFHNPKLKGLKGVLK